MIDMRQEFDKIMDGYGHYILVVHNNRNIRCSCWNSKTQEAVKTCPLCFGLGHTPVVQKEICREKIITVSDSMGRILRPDEYGESTVPSRVYYLRYNVNIDAKDFIVDCKFDRKDMPLLSDYRIYEVNYAEYYRGERGRVEYVKAYASTDSVNMEIVAANIRTSGNRDIYNIGMRRIDNE